MKELNGKLIGTKNPDCVNTVIWKDVLLTPGTNHIRLDAVGLACEADWQRL